MISLIALCMASCDSFDYHPYADDINGRKDIHSMTIPEIERLCQGHDTIRFAFITDTQGSYDEMHDAVNIIHDRNDIMFVVHGGDQSDFGLIREFEWCRDEMERLGKPYISIIGNHDCLGTGEHTFQTLYGNPNYSLNAGFAHILCLNTVALEYDYSNPVPDLAFIENDIQNTRLLNEKHDSITNTIVFMHASPFDEQFNNNVAKPFEYYLRKYPGMEDNAQKYPDEMEDTIKAGTLKDGVCIYGHVHSTGVKDAFDDGLLYYSCTNMGDREFLIFTVTKDGYECEKVDY